MICKIRSVAILGTVVGMMSAAVLAQSAPSPAQNGAAASDKPVAAATDAAPASMIPPDQQATKEQIAKLFEVIRVREQMKSLMNMLPAMVQQQMQEQMKEISSTNPQSAKMTPERQAALDKVMHRYMEKAMNIYPVDEMIADLTEIYQRHVSSTDVDAFIAFYSSPAGQHLLDEQPAIMKEYMPRAMEQARERSKGMTADLMKEIADAMKPAAPAKAPAKR